MSDWGWDPDVDVEKDIDVDIDYDLDADIDIDFDKDKDVDIDVDSDVDIDDNLTEVFVTAEAIGHDTLVEVDVFVLTTDDLSSAEVSVISAVG